MVGLFCGGLKKREEKQKGHGGEAVADIEEEGKRFS
jgi:hypothetical protein